MRYTTTMNQEMKRRVTACAAGFSLPRYRVHLMKLYEKEDMLCLD